MKYPLSSLLVSGLLVALGLGCPNTAQSALVGYWNFDEGSGLTANDFSPFSNHGTLEGTPNVPTWTANGGGHTGNTGDYAIDFDQGRVRVPDSASLHITNTFTVASWMFDTGTFYGHIFAAGANSGGMGRNWFLQTSNFGGDAAYFWSDSNGAFQQNLGWIPTQNSWHHIAVTYDGTGLRIRHTRGDY